MRRVLVFFAILGLLANPMTVPSARAQTSVRDAVLFGGGAWVLPGFKSGIDCYLAKRLSWPNQRACALTFSRTSIATCPDASGNWYTVGNNVPCLTNLGLWVWEGRTNGIPDSACSSGIPGSPGSLCLNWATNFPSGITQTVNAISSQNGLSYISLTFSGTPGSSSTVNIYFDSTSGISATQGQTFTVSDFVSLGGGSITNTSNFQIGFQVYNSGSFQQGFQTTTSSPTTASLGSQRSQFSATITDAATAVRPLYFFNVTSGQPINIVLNIGAPQLELNSFINSTVASAATNASGTGGTNGTAVYSVGGGTCGTTPTLNVTWTAGVLTVNSVANAGSCTTFPPSPAALTYVSGTASGWTGASVNLTPTNNAAQGFATSPIPTSGSAAARAGDVPSVTNIPASICVAACSLVAWGTPQAPAAYAALNQFFMTVSDSTNNNRVGVYRNQETGLPSFVLTSAGSSTFTAIGGTDWLNVNGKIAQAAAVGTQTGAWNGATQSASAAAMPLTSNELYIGVGGMGGTPCNCVISRFAINPNVALPATTLQTATNLNLYNYLLERDLPEAPEWLKMRFGRLPMEQVNDNVPPWRMREAG